MPMSKSESQRIPYGIPTADRAGSYLERRFSPLQRTSFDFLVSLALEGCGIAEICSHLNKVDGIITGAIMAGAGFMMAVRGGMSLQEAVQAAPSSD